MLAEQAAAPLTFAMGYGQSDTHALTISDHETGEVRDNPHKNAGKPYGGITGREIAAMAANPASEAKENAPWFIGSTFKDHTARQHEAQRSEGSYHILPVDIDKGGPSLNEVERAVVAAVGGDVSHIIYSSSSATVDLPKWRILFFLDEPVSGEDYKETQQALFALLNNNGLTCDQALDRTGQLIFLPNVPPSKRDANGKPLFYQYKLNRAKLMRLDETSPIYRRREVIRADVERALEASRERQARKAAMPILPGDGVNPIDAFNKAHSLDALLEKYGYKRQGQSQHWQSPNQTSGSYAVRVYDGATWVSLSGSDMAAGIGASKDCCCYGDAFDLFKHYEHNGDQTAAVRAYGQEINPSAPSTVVSLNLKRNPQFEIATDSNQFREITPEEKAAIPAALFKPWKAKDLTQIPYPDFVYSDFYARGYTSVTLAPPKVGKSMLGLAEAIDMATGRGILTGVEREPIKVVYYNAEDDQDVIDSRVAALLSHYQIDQSEIEGRLFPTSGVEMDEFVMVAGQDGVINEPLFVSIEKFIAESGAAALIFDPLQDLSHSPETNEVFRLLGQRLRRLASMSKVALGLIHHTRKIAPGVTPTIDDGRGGSALRGTSRFNRLLIGMSEDEAAKAGIDNHRHYLRIADMESNLAPPSADVNRWFRKVSVQTPNGKYVGAVEAWKWPDAFDGVTRQDAARVRSEIDQMAEPPRADVRSASWAGNVVAGVLGLNMSEPKNSARVKSILSKWIETDVLRIVESRDTRAGRPVNIVVCGANNPMSGATQ